MCKMWATVFDMANHRDAMQVRGGQWLRTSKCHRRVVTRADRAERFLRDCRNLISKARGGNHVTLHCPRSAWIHI